jgi:hypothetical protein
MIQRIQTIFIFISFVLSLLLIFLPFAEILVGAQIYKYNAFSISLLSENNEIITHTYPIISLIVILSLLLLLSILLYKKRLLQLRLCFISIMLSFGIYGIGYFYIYKISSEYETIINYSYTVIFPLISIVLLIMAMRSIKKDEKLIRSLDRIR